MKRTVKQMLSVLLAMVIVLGAVSPAVQVNASTEEYEYKTGLTPVLSQNFDGAEFADGFPSQVGSSSSLGGKWYKESGELVDLAQLGIGTGNALENSSSSTGTSPVVICSGVGAEDDFVFSVRIYRPSGENVIPAIYLYGTGSAIREIIEIDNGEIHTSFGGKYFGLTVPENTWTTLYMKVDRSAGTMSMSIQEDGKAEVVSETTQNLDRFAGDINTIYFVADGTGTTGYIDDVCLSIATKELVMEETDCLVQGFEDDRFANGFTADIGDRNALEGFWHANNYAAVENFDGFMVMENTAQDSSATRLKVSFNQYIKADESFILSIRYYHPSGKNVIPVIYMKDGDTYKTHLEIDNNKLKFTSIDSGIAIPNDTWVTLNIMGDRTTGKMTASMEQEGGETVLSTASMDLGEFIIDRIEFAADGASGTTGYIDSIRLSKIAPKLQLPADSGKHISSNLVLKEDLGVNFYLELGADLLAGDKDVKVLFDLPNGATKEVALDKNNTISYDGKTLYKFSCDVAAKEMAADITGTLLVDDVETTTFTYSVRDYADTVFNNLGTGECTKELGALAKAMLNYGAMAQTYFNFNPTVLANNNYVDADLANTVIEKPAGISARYAGIDDKIEFISSSLILKSKVTMRLYFNVAEGVTPTFTYNGKTLAWNPVNAAGAEYNGYVEISDIAAKDLDKLAEVQISDGTASATIYYSPIAYCNVVIQSNSANATDALKNLMRGLYKYSQAAKVFF